MSELVWIGVCFFGVLLLVAAYRLITAAEIKMTQIKRGIWGYHIFYTDQKEDKQEGILYSKLLVSETYGIQGKPDYIYAARNEKKMIPVELKSGVIKDGKPHRGDLLQLLAYFLIIEDVYGIKARQGRLIYKNTMFIVKNTAKLRKILLGELQKMRDMLLTGETDAAAQPSFAKCKHCLCKNTVCDKR